MLILSVYKEEILQNQYTILPHTHYFIGRKGKGAEVEIDHPFVSARHLRFSINEDAQILLTDEGSMHGTFLNTFQNRLTQHQNYTVQKQDILYLALNSGISLRFSYKEEKKENEKGKIIDFFAQNNPIRIGRATDNEIILAHPSISRYHTCIYKKDNQFILRDLKARNGTFVNGSIIVEDKIIGENDWIQIGPYQFSLQTLQSEVLTHQNTAIAAIIAKDLLTTLPNQSNILDLRGSSLPIPEGEMIAVMGPSGCGKSTLINALSGNFPANPENGSIKIWGFELNQVNFPYLKQFIGFVPQEDIVHDNLRVEECLYYAAKLKLPDATEAERQQRTEQVLRDLHLIDNQDFGIKSKMISQLSGGQKKRISIAIELLSNPTVLFLDEPTSPLDPQTVEDFLICLRNLTKGKTGEKGTTIIMVTHKPEDLAYMDKVIFMATGGFLTYYGDIEGLKNYWNVKNLTEIYAKTDTIEKGKAQSLAWQQSEKVKLLTKYIPQKEKQQATCKMDSPFRQFYWLSRRYFTLKTNDLTNTLLMLAQAPLIALLMCLMFDKISLSWVFMLSISALWFATNNAGREIVGEKNIYLRERMFNLQLLPYICSKMSILMAFSVLQIGSFLAILSLKFPLPKPFILAIIMFVLSCTAIVMGLLISAIAKNNEQVMTTIPMVLIPQILLAGVLSEVEGSIEYVSRLSLLRWGNSAFADAVGQVEIVQTCSNIAHNLQKCADNLPNLTSIPKHALQSEIRISVLQLTWEQNILILLGLGFVLFCALTLFIKRKDPFLKLKRQ